MKDCDNGLVNRVLTAATTVHRISGPGLLESVYELALMAEFKEVNIDAQRQVEIPVYYKGQNLGLGFRADVIVENCLLLELKAVNEISNIHVAQVITYLKLLNYKRGYLLNFNTQLLKNGIKRISI
jgi:GxxExxY protein